MARDEPRAIPDPPRALAGLSGYPAAWVARQWTLPHIPATHKVSQGAERNRKDGTRCWGPFGSSAAVDCGECGQ